MNIKWYEKLLAAILSLFVPKLPKPKPPAPPSLDAIPIDAVIFDHAFDRSAPIVATLSAIQIALPQTIEWLWTHPQWLRWANGRPDPTGVIGTMWIIAKIDGLWRAAGWEWLLPDTTRSTTEAHPGEPPFIQTKVGPTNAWYPRSGEEIGFMVSTITPSWDGPPPHLQAPGRSPIVITRWP
jgi:hypothetical protein